LSNQAEEIQLAQELETQIGLINTGVTTLGTEIAALQAQAENGQPLEFSGVNQALSDLTNSAAGVTAAAAAAAPTTPAAPANPGTPTT
jgi:hypothetical protein